MYGDYTSYQKWNSNKTTDVTLLAADSNKDNCIAVKSANHQLFIQKIYYNVVTAAAQTVTFRDDAGTPIVIGVIPASVTTSILFDYGPRGYPLTAGKNLDIINTAGPAGQIHIEAYEKVVSGALNTNSAS